MAWSCDRRPHRSSRRGVHGVAVRRLANQGEKFFAMGSGPMRARGGKEALFDDIGPTAKQPARAVGVLETAQAAARRGRRADRRRLQRVDRRMCTLLVARPPAWRARCRWWPGRWRRPCTSCTSCKFDLTQVVSGYGVAPLPPIAADDLAGDRLDQRRRSSTAAK